ncbi:MAG: hypothetical protein K2O91_05150 [Lachnospiraceae bacterium]|nr:hypothetical protein [Lachnospiraceae bacterium]
MDKKFDVVRYSWEKNILNFNTVIPQEKKEKWEKILGKKVYQMVEKENYYLLSDNVTYEGTENQNILEIENMYYDYIKNFDCEKLHIQAPDNLDMVFYPFFYSLYNFGIDYLKKRQEILSLITLY